MADTTLRATDLATGQADYYFLIETDAGLVWDGTHFVIYAVPNRPLYRMVATESPPLSGRYSFPFPAVAAGTYTWQLSKGPGLTSDPRYGLPTSGYWDGAAFVEPVSTMGTAPTPEAIRQEMDANSTKLARLDVNISTRSTYAGADTPGTATLLGRLTAERASHLDQLAGGGAGLDALGDPRLACLNATVASRSTYAGADTPGTTTLLGRLTLGRAINLDFLDVAVSSRLAAAGYTPPPAVTTPPTVVQIRQEMDANSTKLAQLDVAVSSRSTYAGADTAGTATLLLRLTDLRALNLDKLDAAISSRLAATSYVTPTTPPTVVQIRQEMDTNSVKLARLDANVSTRSTYAGTDTPGTTTLLGRLTEQRAAWLDNLDPAVLGGLVAASFPTTAEIVMAVFAEPVVNTTSFRILLASVAAPLAGNLVENADHTTSAFTDINDPGGPVRVSSHNTALTRQVSIH